MCSLVRDEQQKPDSLAVYWWNVQIQRLTASAK